MKHVIARLILGMTASFRRLSARRKPLRTDPTRCAGNATTVPLSTSARLIRSENPVKSKAIFRLFSEKLSNWQHLGVTSPIFWNSFRKSREKEFTYGGKLNRRRKRKEEHYRRRPKDLRPESGKSQRMQLGRKMKKRGRSRTMKIELERKCELWN